jgi:hypothetical protein
LSLSTVGSVSEKRYLGKNVFWTHGCWGRRGQQGHIPPAPSFWPSCISSGDVFILFLTAWWDMPKFE